MISKSDITTKSGCKELLKESKKLGPVGGIFNLAAQLLDGILENQTAAKFEQCMAPKALVIQFLDELSRKMCPNLHYFVAFSSVSCGIGNAGQSNYGMANSAMERMIEQRHRDGLPAKAIQWGAVGDVGLAYETLFKNISNQFDFEIAGAIPQSISSCLAVLDVLITSYEPIVSSMVLPERAFEKESQLSVIEKVMRILNVKNIKTIPPGNV